MIFLTTGTQLPFDRLVKAVDEWAEAAKLDCIIFGQVLSPAHNPYLPRNFETTTRLSPTEYAEIFSKARLVISHAGMGTILTALTQGKQICVLPRQAQYDEHRNDHQLATVKRLGDHPGLYKARDEQGLPTCLNMALMAAGRSHMATIDPVASSQFTCKLREFIRSPNQS